MAADPDVSIFDSLHAYRRDLKARLWKQRGSVPHASGSSAAKWRAVTAAMAGSAAGYGHDDAGLDERVVEYAWLFDRMAALSVQGTRVLDAGSVLNYAPVLRAWQERAFPPVSIVTLAYEGHAFVSNAARYEFADLRHLPYRDEWFSTVLCLSTIEHVGLDNRIYGASVEASSDPTREAVRALHELRRVTKKGGTLLLSVPFGTRSHRGWFRIFDTEDLEALITVPGWQNVRTRFFRATRDGWRESSAVDAESAGYNEPPGRPGQRTAPRWVAAAEAVALVEMTRG